MRLKYDLGDALRNDVDVRNILAHTCLLQFKVIPAPREAKYKVQDGNSHFEKADAWNLLLTRLAKHFDFIVLDTPSANGMCAFQASANADAVVIPVQSEYLALRDLKKSLMQLKVNRKNEYAKMRNIAVLLTMHQAGAMISNRILTSVRNHLSRRLCDTIIPWDPAISRSAAEGKPGIVKSPKSPSALAYRQLADELIERFSFLSKS
jgi:chromosome partitioning protein